MFNQTEHVRRRRLQGLTWSGYPSNDDDDVRMQINLKSLCKLAFRGIKERTFYFCDKDFRNPGLQEADISTFFTTFHAKDKTNPLVYLIKATKKLSYFSHLILQEFFAAIYMIFYLEPEEFISDANQIKLSSSDFEVVTKFLFGLCNEHTTSILQTIDKDQFTLPTKTVSFLKEYLRSSLPKSIELFDFVSVSNASVWLYELNDKKFTREVSNFLTDCLVIKGDVFPNDVLPLCNLMQEKFNLVINIFDDANFHNNAHLLFFKEMDQITAVSSHIKVRSSFILYIIYSPSF